LRGIFGAQGGMPCLRKWFVVLAVILFGMGGTERTEAASLDQLRRLPNLTPELLARRFARFAFQFQAAVQEPEEFLRRRAGDCDDFAILAAMLLRERGYTPRLIAVRMPAEVHVVCYISEIGGYLDYNLRNARHPVVPSPPALDEIAHRVAAAFRQPWTSVSEFTFDNRTKYLVRTMLLGEREFLQLAGASLIAPAFE
jgi:hypothetical protein